jgi:hypothetical protein
VLLSLSLSERLCESPSILTDLSAKPPNRTELRSTARTSSTVCRSGSSFPPRGESRVHVGPAPTKPVPHDGWSHVAVMRAALPTHSCIHWPPSRLLYQHTRLLRQWRPMPSLPGSMTLSCASGRRNAIPTTLPSGSSPTLSATRDTLRRAP